MDARALNLIGALTVALNDRLTAGVEGASGRAGVGSALLTTVLGAPGIGVRDLSAATGISPSGVVRLLDRLVDEGLVRRDPGVDGRSVAIQLTPSGRRTARRVLEHRAEHLGAALDALEPGEIDALAAAAEKVVAALTVDDAAGWRICRLCDVAACPVDTCPVEQATA